MTSKIVSFINYDYLANIGMLRIDFNLLKKYPTNIHNFFYSIYGDMGYVVKGGVDISNFKNKDYIPNLFLKVNGNTLFFIKLKYEYEEANIEEHKFINILSMMNCDNIKMNIVDKSIEDTFHSINLDELDNISINEDIKNTNFDAESDNYKLEENDEIGVNKESSSSESESDSDSDSESANLTNSIKSIVSATIASN